MADDANEQNNTPEPPGGQQNTDTGQKPPWERDGEEFSPEKAWNLIQHRVRTIRNSKRKRGQQRQAARDRGRELTEQEKLQRDLKETREQLAQVNMAKAWAEARAKYPSLTEQDFDLIGGDNPEEVMDKAAKLAARIDAQAAKDADQNNINPLQRVHAKPSGGTDPTSNPATDWLRDALTSK
ncbi:hypothetical protein BLI708_00035 [Bifidobacterium imperatoris]|uniref:Heavy metal transporter n=1 Tax=Bifidobacterium imperatoris TaxID=2020965 RepID=A0ABX7S0N2_9BIFI|nr:hypothetical protein [Bifidobacterium imperatoris]QSY57778.1 hypothetical protein BLI708_00035 [Bifidobacterium imperatoris]